MPPPDPHAEWLGNVQPQGVLVTSTALQTHGIVPNANGSALAERQTLLAAWRGASDTPGLLTSLFGWQPTDIVPSDQLPDELIMQLEPAAALPLPQSAFPAAQPPQAPATDMRPTWAR